MNEKTTAIVGSVIREFVYRTLLAYVLLHVMALMMPMTARADVPNNQDSTACLLAAVFGTGAPDAAGTQELRYARAMDNYQESRWQTAFEQFAALADEGHGASARMAWQMWRHGPNLFGQAFAAGTFQRHHWRDVWRCAAEPSDSRCSNLVSNQLPPVQPGMPTETCPKGRTS